MYQTLPLFGGSLSWVEDDWTASDDTVRGGKSKSYLTINEDQVLFDGNLDTKTLGGAGFCSQRTTRDDRHWNLASYDGIQIICDANKSDGKVYTFILKDEILPKSPNGREKSTISWEYDFKVEDTPKDDVNHHQRSLRIAWKDFKPTYRGRPKEDAGSLRKGDIRRMSIMMRSFFDSQSGDFRLAIGSIEAYKGSQETDNVSGTGSTYSLQKADVSLSASEQNHRWTRWLCCL